MGPRVLRPTRVALPLVLEELQAGGPGGVASLTRRLPELTTLEGNPTDACARKKRRRRSCHKKRKRRSCRKKRKRSCRRKKKRRSCRRKRKRSVRKRKKRSCRRKRRRTCRRKKKRSCRRKKRSYRRRGKSCKKRRRKCGGRKRDAQPLNYDKEGYLLDTAATDSLDRMAPATQQP
ncbi:hypothetical protein AAG570_010180 [Ranatra chinensis]|uniref:Uncharacterized protein n=1 Tax=Ranatra chinensis TaxID=642074 RepID=A0ABD0Z3X4_9HEMI